MEKAVADIINREVLNDVTLCPFYLCAPPLCSAADTEGVSADLSFQVKNASSTCAAKIEKKGSRSSDPAESHHSTANVTVLSPPPAVSSCVPFAAMTPTLGGSPLSKFACHESLTGVTISASTVVAALTTSSIEAIAEIDALFQLLQR